MGTHNWDRILGRGSATLTRGKQYTCQPHSMAQQVRNAAAKRGLSVSIRILGDVVKVTVVGRIGASYAS